MKNLAARFTGGDSTLRVTARTGKKGIVVMVRISTPGTKAKVGCRHLFTAVEEPAAIAKFGELRESAIAKGWAEKVKADRSVPEFTVIPTPAEAVKPTETPKNAKTKKAA